MGSFKHFLFKRAKKDILASRMYTYNKDKFVGMDEIKTNALVWIQTGVKVWIRHGSVHGYGSDKDKNMGVD